MIKENGIALVFIITMSLIIVGFISFMTIKEQSHKENIKKLEQLSSVYYIKVTNSNNTKKTVHYYTRTINFYGKIKDSCLVISEYNVKKHDYIDRVIDCKVKSFKILNK